MMDAKDAARLRRTVWAYYRKHGRHDLPWRKTSDPYRILVSEVMLQQTQVDRVIPKYRAFLHMFPTVRVLARTSLLDVLRAWQGLGYNRRAKMLHDACRYMVEHCGGQVPRAYDELVRLPGVGPYTARAVCVFAYNEPGIMVETNIRTVLFHHLYPMRAKVHDAELYRSIDTLCSKNRAREWYWALMDYGAHLKAQGVRLNHKSKHYTKQSKFEGSDRQIRGAIVRLLTTEHMLIEYTIIEKTGYNPIRVQALLVGLVQEGMVAKVGRHFTLPDVLY